MRASGQMIVNVSSWSTLIPFATHLPAFMSLPSPFPLLPLGSTSITHQDCYKCLR